MGSALTPEFEVARQRIETFTAKWDELMDMGWLSIKNTFNPNFNEDSHDIVATTSTDWEYRATGHDFHLPKVCSISDETLEAVVVHEKTHALLASMESNVKSGHDKECEFAVESVARALLSVHRASNGE